MKNLNSDQLRAQLRENNCAMNILAEDNQEIVELLSQRGLQAINYSSDLEDIRLLLERRAETAKPEAGEEVVDQAQDEINKLRAENEKLRLQLSACGAAAMANTVDSAPFRRITVFQGGVAGAKP